MKAKSGTSYDAAKQKGDDQGSGQNPIADDTDKYRDAECVGVSVQDAYTTLIHDRKMKRALVRIPFPILYFGLFVAMLFQHIPSTSLYKLGYSVSSTLASSGVDTVTTDSTMKFTNIQTIEDTFSWLTDTFVPSTFVTEDYNGDALEKDKWGRVAMFNKVLGAVHFERTLAHIHPCQAAQFLKDLYPNCYDSAHTTTESLLLSFDTNAAEATDVINQLKATGKWLDFATQSLTITIVSYNGELQGYAVTELLIQFNQGGSIDTSSWTTPALSDPYQADEPLVLDILVGICFLFALTSQVLKFVRHRRDRSYFTSVWTIIEHASSGVVIAFYVVWLSIVLFMYQRSFRDNLARLVVSGKTFAADSDERNGLMAVTKSLQRIARLTIALRLIALFAVFLLGLRIVKRFRFHPRLSILTRTIASALDQFRWFFVVFIVIFVTFAISGTVLFGDRVEGFSSLQLSIETCINMLFGNFDYSTIQGLYTPVAMIYYWGYMIVVSLVLLNMMLAIVLDAYAAVSSETFQNAKNMSLSRPIASIAMDPMDLLYSLKNLTSKYRKACQKKRDMAVLDKSMVPGTAAHNDQLAQEWSHSEVVFRGMIKPRVLLKVLEAVFDSQRTETPTCFSPALTPISVLTAQTLKNLFAGAHISDSEARATLLFLRDGMGESSTPSDRKDPLVVASHAGERKPDDASASKPASLVHEHAVTNSEAAHDGLHSPVSSVPVTETPAEERESARHVKQLVAQMEVMEKKLDLLLYKTSLA